MLTTDHTIASDDSHTHTHTRYTRNGENIERGEEKGTIPKDANASSGSHSVLASGPRDSGQNTAKEISEVLQNVDIPPHEPSH